MLSDLNKTFVATDSVLTSVVYERFSRQDSFCMYNDYSKDPTNRHVLLAWAESATRLAMQHSPSCA